MHKLFAKQLAEATRPDSGSPDLDRLAELVSAAYEEAEQKYEQLRNAFEVIPEGLAVFDKDDRYVLWNECYADIYRHGGHQFEVGARFEDVLRAGLKSGQYFDAVGRGEAWVQERLAQHRQPSNTEIQRVSDDRWVRVEERRTADGGSVGVRVDITHLKQSEESFRLLFESNPLPMVVCAGKSLRILAVNDMAVIHYGYSREQFMKMSVYDVRAPEERAELRIQAESGVGTHQTGTTRRHIKADGSIIDVAVYARPLIYEGEPATIFAVIDLTERKRAEDEVRETREFLTTVIDNVPVTVTVKDARDFRYILVNRAAEKFMGISREQVLGKTVHEFFPKAAADAINERDEKLLISGREVITDDRPFHHASNGARHITSRRITVPDLQGKPRYLVGVVEDITELKAAEAQISHLANHDSLTDLPNRAAFEKYMRDSLERAKITGDEFGVICLDLDRFKGINDVFGHGAGDIVLQETSRRLNAAAEGAFIARLGGDEFTLIVPGKPQPRVTESVVEKLQAAMIEDVEAEGQRFKVGLSIGVSMYPLDGSDAKTLLNNADAALYRAKAGGRGAVRFFEPEMDEQLRERRLLQHDLRIAVECGELFLNYQPQAKMNSDIIGFEALARWNNPRLGMVSPATFIPLAEESGIIIQLGEWILREACREAASWQRPLNISVNLSPVQFQHGDLPSLVHAILLETGLSPHRLELEITEGVLIRDFSHTVSVLRRLKTLGVRIAMDDFGTGYSSLSYLQSFPFDKIKIDQSFISSLKQNPQSAAIIRAVIGLGRGLDLPVTAEGVETREQLEFLKFEACTEVQGYLIGRPHPISVYHHLTGNGLGPDQRREAI